MYTSFSSWSTLCHSTRLRVPWKHSFSLSSPVGRRLELVIYFSDWTKCMCQALGFVGNRRKNRYRSNCRFRVSYNKYSLTPSGFRFYFCTHRIKAVVSMLQHKGCTVVQPYLSLVDRVAIGSLLSPRRFLKSYFRISCPEIP